MAYSISGSRIFSNNDGSGSIGELRATGYSLTLPIRGTVTRYQQAGNNVALGGMNIGPYSSVGTYQVTYNGLSITIKVSGSPEPVIVAPTAPSLYASPYYFSTGTAINVSWNSVSGATYYYLERSVNGGSWSQVYSGGNTSFKDTAQSSWNSVVYRIKASGAGGTSSYRNSSTLVRMTAPNTPSGITVPGSVKPLETINISWSSASGASSYFLERSVNGGGWEQVTNTASTSYSEPAQNAWLTVVYRVRAYNDVGYSAYATSTVCTVVHNQPPAITGTDSNLGIFDQSLTMPSIPTYTVTDPNTDDTVTVEERLDTVVLKTYTATLGTPVIPALLPDIDYQKLANGVHTYSITATDSSHASTVRTYLFTKAVTVAEVRMTDPVEADDMPTVCRIVLTGNFPEGSKLTVQVCNNGFDENPVWQDCSAIVNKSQNIAFANTEKTAEKWGIRVWAKLERLIAQGPCFISTLGGTFK